MKNLIVAQNTLDYNLARPDDTVIRAPFIGLIVRRDREPGDVVVPGSSIFLLISTKELWESAWVDETEMGRRHPVRLPVSSFVRNRTALIPGKCRALVVKQTGRPASSLWMWR